MIIVEKDFTKDSYTVVLEATEHSKDLRIDQFLQLYLLTLSRELIKNKIKRGEVILIDRPGNLRPSTKVLKGDQVKLFVKRGNEEDEYWRGEVIKTEKDPAIIFEDEDLIVIAKPPYMATHPTGRHLFYCATVYFESIHKKTIHSIHRLDRETSGILLLGKSPKVSGQLGLEFEEDRVRKVYFFIARPNSNFKGQLEFWARERLDNPEEGLRRVIVQTFPESSQAGKKAETFFKILYQNENYVIGLAFPITGRQHQIRVHALHHGLPLVGDKLYLGGYEMFQRFKDNLASDIDYDFIELPRHALHSVAMKIPFKGKDQLFLSPVPKDLKEWIEKKLKLNIQDLEKKMADAVNSYFLAK